MASEGLGTGRGGAVSYWDMPRTVYISEAEAARDFGELMRRVRAGDEVVVEDGGHAVAVVRAASLPRKGKTLREVIESLRSWEAEHGPLRMGADFADDVEEAHGLLNRPLDDSKWD